LSIRHEVGKGPGNTLTVHTADGTRIPFVKNLWQTRRPKAGTRGTQADVLVQYSTISTALSGMPEQTQLHARETALGYEYTLTLPNQTRYLFDPWGHLVQILAPTGEAVSMQRDPTSGVLLRVSDPQGRFLSLRYPNKKTNTVQHIDSPVGRFSYEYGGGALSSSLAKVTLPTHYDHHTLAHSATSRGVSSSSVAKTYHYEDARWPTLLTGISVQGQGSDGQVMGQRLVSWAYDAAARAVLSVKGAYPAHTADPQKPGPEKPGPEQVRLDFAGQKSDGSGFTVLTNSLGQTTRYTYAMVKGRPELLEARGPGCATCSASNVRYVFDDKGRRTQEIELVPDSADTAAAAPATANPQSSAPAVPLRGTLIEYDAVNRPVRLSTVAYVNGKAQAPVFLVRYQYGADVQNTRPTMVERASVVPGKLHQTHLSYNAQGQVTQVTETGYSPLDEKGLLATSTASPTSVPTAITRTTTYTYQSINGRSVLVQIDGPLKNGPKATPEDSDITTLRYDVRADYLIATTAPGNFTTTLTYDHAGRITRASVNDGFRQIDTTTAFEGLGSIATQPKTITRSAWMLNSDGKLDRSTEQTVQLLQARFDALGRRTHSIGADGQNQTLSYAGTHPTKLVDAQGQQIHWAYDTEGRLLAQVSQDANGQVTQGRMWLRDAQGRLRATLNPQGLERIFVYADRSPGATLAEPTPTATTATTTQATSKATATNTQVTSTNLITATTLRDDFGRVVLERLPEDGTITTVFDSSPGAEVQTQTHTSTDHQQQLKETLVFDMAGRLQSRSRSLEPCTETLRYQGPLLMQLQGCANAQQFARDAFGRITLQTQMLNANSSTTRYHYDARGQLSSRTMPDGQVLRYRYGEPNEATPGKPGTQEVGLQRAWLTFLTKLTGQSAASTLVSWLPTGWSEKTLYDQGVEDLKPPVQVARATRSDGVQAVKIKAQTQTQTQAPVRDTYGRQTRHVPSTGVFAGQAQTLVWNSAHQLAAVHTELDGKPGALLARYQYDARGNRISKTLASSAATSSETTTHYLYDNAHRLLAQTDATGKVTRHYLYKDHRVYSILEGGHVYQVQTDWRGLPTQVSDENKTTVWAQEFDAWGHAVNTVKTNELATNTFDMPLRLAGQQYDPETGLHYNIHRYFDPVQGRYISPDPLGTPDGSDRYTYVKGNPNAGIDPLGLFEIPKWNFFGFDTLPTTDGGHGDIVRAAFAQYNYEAVKTTGSIRFSQTIIDQIILNNYHTDAASLNGGQFTATNHFDNPNDGPMCQDAACNTLLPNYSTSPGAQTNWVGQSLNQINANRNQYQTVTQSGVYSNISTILNRFGQNTHTLADFYAHSNWVDDTNRGGCVRNWIGTSSTMPTRAAPPGIEYKTEMIGTTPGVRIYEVGYVPVGLNRRELWTEDVSNPQKFFSGTVKTLSDFTGCISDINCTQDKTSHGYWNKDHDAPASGGFTQAEIVAMTNQGLYS
jgi:RHS repeat-associated protein